ncbi:MAG: AarF/ABC1/UbiB kinase family protein [Phycisphaerae bacterium]|nr:AarF/ABC1/UbiB kinase family protein [Phycisphaerae bacterium]
MPIRGFGFIGRRYRHITRYRQIATVLLKHGFGDLMSTLGMRRRLGLGKRQADLAGTPAAHLTRWQRIRLAMEELGPSFVKLGQILATRPDMIPQELCDELAKLHDTVAPFPFNQAKQTVENELGDSLDTIFEKFDKPPVASASIAQVHKAVLPESDEVVAVKIQRPGIRRIIEVDLEIMMDIAVLMERHLHGLDAVHPVGIVEEFARTIRKELDFSIEAGHIERFARNFQGNDTIFVPKVFGELSSRKVLTMEFVEGVKVSDLAALREDGFDLELIAGRGADLLLEQIFVHGFFHADPHPGNILILPANVICFLDYGMMGTISPRYKDSLADMVIGIVRRDEKQITKAVLDLSAGDETAAAEKLEADVADFIEQHFYRSLKDIDMGELITQLIQLFVKHRLRIIPDFYLLTKALATVEGNGRVLSPDFDMIKNTEPFARKIMAERFSPKTLAKGMYRSGIDLGNLMRDLPGDIREIVAQIKRGRMHVEFEHRGLEPMLKTHDQISNRIAFALILAALIIGSSVIVLSGIPPKWYGIPVFGIVGYLAAGAMGFWLLISILRHGKM